MASERGVGSQDSPDPLLASVQYLARGSPLLAGIPGVLAIISECLDYRLLWGLPRACALGDLRLLKRIADREKRRGEDAWTEDEPLFREWRFDAAAVAAARAGNLEVLQWVMTEHDTVSTASTLVEEAAKSGQRRVLQWLYQRFGEEPSTVYRGIHGIDKLGEDSECLRWGGVKPRVFWGGNELRYAVANSDLETAQWIWENDIAGWGDLDTAAANAGNMPTIRWLHSIQYSITPAGIAAAAEHGHLEALQSLVRHWGSCLSVDHFATVNSRTPYKFVDLAAANGHLQVVQWLHESQSSGCTRDAIDRAAANGHANVVEWLHANRSEGCTAQAMDTAASNGHLQVVRFLDANRSEGCTPRAMDSATANGHLHVVQWLHAHRHEGCTTNAMDEAATNGHHEIVRWLHEHRVEGCTTRAMDGAAAHGHFEIVRWLGEHRSEGCTTAAMDNAAGNGHLGMVQWLHAHRVEGCTTRAMDNAAARGHADVVKWLHSMRTEGCSVGAMDGAAGSGQFKLLKWLHQHCAEGCSPAAIDRAAAIGRLDIIQWLDSEYGCGCSNNAMENAADAGHFEVLLYLHYKEMARPSVEVGEAAVEAGHTEIVRWCSDHHALYHFKACLIASRLGYVHLAEWLT